MASTKIVSLLVRTLAKPISSSIKENAKQHPLFREWTISIAQRMHRLDMRLRSGVLVGSTPKHVRPLNDAKAIDQGANFLAEGFLFAVAAGLIIGESVRSSIKTANRRDTVDDKLDDLSARQREFESLENEWRERMQEMQEANDQRIQKLTYQLDNLVDIGRRGGWLSRSLQNVNTAEPTLPATADSSTSATTTTASEASSQPSLASSDNP